MSAHSLIRNFALFAFCIYANIGICNVVSHFQNKIDSLKKTVYQTEEKNRADIYIQIAAIYSIVNDKESLYFADSALTLARLYGQKKNEVLALRLMAFRYPLNNQKGEAIEAIESANHYYKKHSNISLTENELIDAIKLIETTGNYELRVEMSENLGVFYLEQERYNEAINILRQVYNYYDTTNRNWEKSKVAALLVEAYIDSDNLSEADHHFNQILDYANKINSLNFIKLYYWLKYKYFLSKKSYEEALNHYQTYSVYKDSILNKENLEQITEVETYYKTVEKENKILDLDKSLKTQKRIQSLMYSLTGTLVVLLIALIVILKTRSISLFKSRTIQQKEKEISKMRLNQTETEKLQTEQKVFAEQLINKLQDEKHKYELEYKNNELSHLTASLIRKNSVLIKAKEILKKDCILSGQNEKAKNLYSFIVSNIDSYNNWHLFKQSFEKTDPDFFVRLKTAYPELTENDHKLCAYLKMNLTTKEMANLLNISEVSVSKRRNRLRKKLKLAPEYDLLNWLKSI